MRQHHLTIRDDHDEPLKPSPGPEHRLIAAVMRTPDVEGADRARCQPGCIHRHDDDRCRLLLMGVGLRQTPPEGLTALP